MSVSSLRQHRPFVLFWWARIAATMSYQMQAVAIGWQIYDLTGSTLALGLAGLVQFVPMVLLSLVVGHVADRYDRRFVIRCCQLAESAAALVLAAGSLGGWLGAAAIFPIILAIGAARAFELPSMHAVLPGLVPAPLFSRAVAGSASANQTAIILGPALGGIVYILGPGVVYALAGAGFLLASILVALIRIERVPRAPEPATLRSLLRGLVFIRQQPAVLGAISLDLFAVLLGGATALLPVYARDILAVGTPGLGVLRSAPALGALSASLYLARQPLRRRVGPTLFAAVACFGAATIVFALSTSLALSLLALAVLGAADAVSVVIRFSLVQMATPDALRGRVSAVNAMFIGASNTLGEFESGLTAYWFGTVPAVLLGGLGTLLVAAVWMVAFPALRRADRFELRRD